MIWIQGMIFTNDIILTIRMGNTIIGLNYFTFYVYSLHVIHLFLHVCRRGHPRHGRRDV